VDFEKVFFETTSKKTLKTEKDPSSLATIEKIIN
jgi:hypothetical protein